MGMEINEKIEFNEKKVEFNDSFSKLSINLNENFDNRYIKPPKTKDIPYKKLLKSIKQ